jgi:prepilin-type N-terminal cleavage/methylation domain-containing protein
MKRFNHCKGQYYSGFTLVEVLVVISIAVLLLGISLGGYSAMRASNQRTNCAADMAQVYQAIRMYADDYNGRPPYYDPEEHLNAGKGIGLWALYAFPDNDNPDEVAIDGSKYQGTYLRNVTMLHCPSDGENSVLKDNNGVFNIPYVSYQHPDDLTNGIEYTYNPVRTTNVQDPNWSRQLVHFDGSLTNPGFVKRPPTDDTVVLWCKHHRGGLMSGAQDNVLFWDGTIQVTPKTQDACGAPPCEGWTRTERNSR